MEGPWSPGVQAVPASHGPLSSQNLPPNARSARPLVRAYICDGYARTIDGHTVLTELK